jgi:hypothetical protein
MPYKGDRTTLGYSIETDFDEVPTQGAQTNWIGIIPNADFDDAPEYKDYHSINTGRDIFIQNIGKINVTGNIPIELQNGRIIYLAMGDESVTGSDPYTHTISGTDGDLPSICIETVYEGSVDFLRYYRGTKINTLDIEAVEGGEVKASAGFISARGEKSANSSSTIAPVNTKPYMYHQGSVDIAGYASYDVTTFKWSINNTLKPRHTIRSTDGKFAKLIIEGKREYEVTANIIIPDAATYNSQIYDYLIAGTEFTTTIVLERSASDKMTLVCSNCTIRTAPHNIPEPGEEVEISISAKPKTCEWTIIDSIATYA